jgi:hypothetical protein
MNRDRNAFIHRPLELGKVGDDRFEHVAAEGSPDLGQVGELKGPSTLEFRHHITKKRESGIVASLNAIDNRSNGRRAPGAPVCGLKRDDDEVRSAERRIAGQRHSRRAIEEDVVKSRYEFGDRVGKYRMEPLALPLV